MSLEKASKWTYKLRSGNNKNENLINYFMDARSGREVETRKFLLKLEIYYFR